MKPARFSKPDIAQLAPMLVVVALLGGYWAYCKWLEPISPYFDNYDPTFAYFLSSLSIFKGVNYTFVDHPGTPVEMLGTALLGLTYPFIGLGREAFIRYQLQNPGLFFDLAHLFLTLASLGCSLFFYKTALLSKRLGDVLTALALAVMFYMLHPWSFVTLNYWSHNSFNFPFGSLFLLALFRSLGIKGEIRLQTLAGLGLGAGILTATQLYFAVWVITSLITVTVFYALQCLAWQKILKAVLLVGFASLAGFFTAVIPVWGQMAKFLEWVYDLVFHVGRYGSGSTGMVSLVMAQKTIETLLRQFPVIFALTLLLAVAMVAIFVRWRKNFADKPELWAMAAGLLAQLVIAFILIIKQPLFLYMLAIAATLPVLTLVVLRFLEGHPLYPRLQGVFFAIVLVGVTLNLVATLSTRHANALEYAYLDQELARQRAAYARQTGRGLNDLVILWTYGTVSRCNALSFGNGYTDRAFRQELDEICPNQSALSLWIWDQNQITVQPPEKAQNFQIPIKDVKWDLIITRKEDFRVAIAPALQVGTTLEEILPPLKWEPNPIVIVKKKPR